VASVTVELVVVSWNVREGLPVEGPDDPEWARSAIVDTVRAHDVDILALQEVDFAPDGESPTLDRIRRETGLRHVAARPLSPSSYVPGWSAGLAILSRYPIVDSMVGEFLNPNLVTGTVRSHDKGFIAATLSGPVSEPLHVVCLHAIPYHLFRRDPAEPAFRAVWQDVARAISKFETGPLLVCGDFNASDRDLVLKAGQQLTLMQLVRDAQTYKGAAARSRLRPS